MSMAQSELPLQAGNMPLPDYAELQCASNFSFLRGASHPEELVARAVQLGYSALALTDECSLSGVVRAHVEAKKHDFHLLIGSQLQVGDMRLIALAKNREGYGNLCELITLARTRVEKGHYLLHPEDLAAPQEKLAHLRGLPDCELLLAPAYGVETATLARQAQWMRETFGERATLALTLLHQGRDERHRAQLQAMSACMCVPESPCRMC
jgi:error-prone DNA polymerase